MGSWRRRGALAAQRRQGQTGQCGLKDPICCSLLWLNQALLLLLFILRLFNLIWALLL
jgi:hypothetical protein